MGPNSGGCPLTRTRAQMLFREVKASVFIENQFALLSLVVCLSHLFAANFPSLMWIRI